ncbi:MAG: L-seryl-tRNA(Sec) selenium transferase [Gammaproteobacteria bacterium]|nr:L-seryl-tRNA(Sec) selenium transferase [Gammaproteobacteria bacterium]
MSQPAKHLPGVDQLLRSVEGRMLVDEFGRTRVARVIAETLSTARRDSATTDFKLPSDDELLANTRSVLSAANPTLKTVLNLTGTILHTNLGRASLPQVALDAVQRVAGNPSNLEFDLETGKRGDRDQPLEHLLKEITGAEAATVVNNNAAAVMLVLNTFALGQDVPVSRGELVEIGGSFRVPEIMTRSGCRLVEVGATNRTRLSDFKAAITDQTAMLMKVHTSNYQIQGFTESVAEKDLAALAHEFDLPFMTDLGSGTLVNLSQYGLPPEPTVQEAVESGADIVTFSGDKLLGGPQAGLIVGTAKAIALIKQNPMKRALRVDKMTLAALIAVLKLYLTPETLVEHLPTLRDLARSEAEIKQFGDTLLPAVTAHLGQDFDAALVNAKSQIGSGALPIDLLPTWAIAISARGTTHPNEAIMSLATRLRQIDTPILGRITGSRLLLDLRTLYSPERLLAGLKAVNAG